MRFSLICWNVFLSSIQICLLGRVGLQCIFQCSKIVKLILCINIIVFWFLCWSALDLKLLNRFFSLFFSRLFCFLFSIQFLLSHLKPSLRIRVYSQWQYFDEYIWIYSNIIFGLEMEWKWLLIVSYIVRCSELSERGW